jgi:hypothetical protein
MKKTSKPSGKKPVAKTPAAKKSSSKPNRKTAGQGELAEVIARLDAIAEKLAVTADRLAQLSAAGTQPLPPAPSETPHTHTDEHSDDVEVAGVIREE